jgi:hypothetical protein
MTEPTLTAAERYAALTALKAGLDDQIAQAKADAIAEVASQRSASWNTPYGHVNMTRAEESVEIHADQFLAFCQEHYPDEVLSAPYVRSSFVDAFRRELTIVAGKVVHKGTGEVVDFARVKPEGAPTISYPASTEQKNAKAYAKLLFDENAATLTTTLRELTR